MLSKLMRLWGKPNDREFCEELLRLHYKPIYAYLRRCCGSADEAEDLTQETFAKAWKSLLTERRPKNPRAWIYCIARHTWLDSARKRGRMQTRSDEWWDNLPAPEPNANAIEERELAAILAQKVQELDDDKREAIILHYYQGLTLRETAGVLGVAPSTVKYRLREAIRALREQIDDNTNPTAACLRKEIQLP